MSYWFLPAFVLGWVFGLLIMKAVRVMAENDIFGILADCAAAWYNANAQHLPAPKVVDRSRYVYMRDRRYRCLSTLQR